MATTTPNRDSRLNFRLAPQHKQLIESAASTLGQTVSDFAVSTLLKASQQTLQESSITSLTIRDRDRFLEILDREDEPNDALKQAAERYKARHA